jgi:type IV pilus assembly protein PilA
MTPATSTSLTARWHTRAKDDAGFTLIELLVVVLIIGVLAAIAIPIYIGVQNNARDSGAKSDVVNAKTADVAYFTDHGTYTSTDSLLASYGYGAPSGGAQNASITLDSVDATKFCVSVQSSTGTWWAATESGGVGQGYCGLFAVFVAGQPG